jgi:hypothetical protein
LASRSVLVGVAAVVGLLVGFGAAYAYQQSQISSLQTSLSQANASISMLHEEMNGTQSVALQPKSGQMIHGGWLILASVGNGDYSVTLHADGLEPPSSGGYIVEGVQRTSAMSVVPIGANATGSEFDAGTDGSGTYWTVLMQNPSTSYESVELVYLPGMNMTAAVVVATASL